MAQWAATDPVFEGLTFSSVIGGGIPTGTVQVSGSVNVDDAAEFVAALVTLHDKGEELNQKMTSHVRAELGARHSSGRARSQRRTSEQKLQSSWRCLQHPR